MNNSKPEQVEIHSVVLEDLEVVVVASADLMDSMISSDKVDKAASSVVVVTSSKNSKSSSAEEVVDPNEEAVVNKQQEVKTLP